MEVAAKKEAKNLQMSMIMKMRNYSILLSTELEIQITGNAIIAVLEEIFTL
jgi:hypothetical protein